MTASSLTVLLAEDDENDVLFIRRAFGRLGTARDLIVVDGGEVLLEYLRLAGARVPDLLLLDHRMPGLNGIEVLFWLRTLLRWKDLPVLLLSNALSPNDQEMVCGLRAAYALKTTLLSDLAPALVEGIRSAFALVDRPGHGRSSLSSSWPPVVTPSASGVCKSTSTSLTAQELRGVSRPAPPFGSSF